MAFKTYDPDQISVVFAGNLIGGFAEGELVRIEQASDDFEDVVGTDGEVSRSKVLDRRATITFRLMQTSESNAVLSALSALDRSTPNGGGVGAFMVRDRGSLATIYTAAEAWVARAPDVSFDRTATPREWTIKVAELVRVDGGN